MTTKAFPALATKYHVPINAGVPAQEPIVENMVLKNDNYDGFLCGDLAQLARILYSHFGTDNMADSNILRTFIEGLFDGEP